MNLRTFSKVNSLSVPKITLQCTRDTVLTFIRMSHSAPRPIKMERFMLKNLILQKKRVDYIVYRVSFA